MKINILCGMGTIALLFLFVGCSGEKLPADLPKLLPCSIKIVLEDGSPVENASVQLIPEDSQYRKWSVGGTTAPDGSLNVLTIGKYKGAVPGKYKVLIQKMKDVEDGEFKNEKGEMEKLYKGVSVLDPVFAKVNTTPLILSLEPDKIDPSVFTVKPAK
ncbi:MAG: hypothetical protein Q4G69_10295 [Planctomycetia bacterium]|nr:hypothetical protein [Planctomycetia bacterium]